MASSDDEDYADQKIKPDASTKTEDEGGCSGDNVNRAGGMRNVTALGLVIFFTDFSTEMPFFVHKITIRVILSSQLFEISSFS